jgi:hypothetical protein
LGHNYYNEGHFTKECKPLNKFCQICKSNENNIYNCPSKTISGRCPSREIVPTHVVQAEVPIIQKQQHNYEAPPQQNQFGNQQYNGQNWSEQQNPNNHYNQCGYNQNNGLK